MKCPNCEKELSGMGEIWLHDDFMKLWKSQKIDVKAHLLGEGMMKQGYHTVKKPITRSIQGGNRWTKVCV
jgi:hypothetical protein